MKVKMTGDCMYKDLPRKKGEELDVQEHEGRDLIQRGMAERAEDDKPYGTGAEGGQSQT